MIALQLEDAGGMRSEPRRAKVIGPWTFEASFLERCNAVAVLVHIAGDVLRIPQSKPLRVEPGLIVTQRLFVIGERNATI